METEFAQVVSLLSEHSLSNDVLHKIIYYLQQQTNETLSLFISESYQSLLILENWVWEEIFTKNSFQLNLLELLHTIASFNFMLIFHTHSIECDTKCSLIIPKDISIIDQIFQQIENIQNPNDPYLILISRWFDNLSYFIHEYTQFETLPVFIHLCQYIGQNFILHNQYKTYLTQLCQSQIPQSVFTAKQLFYVKTCSFLFRMYICSKFDKSIFKADELLDLYGNDFLEIILVHNHTVNSWSRELFACIAHIIDFLCACCWWGNDKPIYMKNLISSEQIFYEYIQGLIKIISYKPFYECIASQWCNDETILIDSTVIFFLGALLEIKNLSCFSRNETILPNVILEIAQKSSYDRISVCAYGILAEILSDEQLKEVKITENISEFFFHILQLAWNHPTHRYKRIPIPQLLRGFLTLSKNDAIQQKAIDSNKLLLLIEICDQYPITYDILWALSFNSDIQQQLRSNKSFMNKVTRLKEECNDGKMRRIIFGILWNLDLNRLDRTISDIAMFDIMISYSHKDEIICKQIYEELIKAGYRVWIDFDQMHGNVMDAMAQAIEKSDTIIICMSEQYRKSNYCRAEAHYAFQRQLKIVPILLQEHYQPDGWLLFLIGQLIYVDFTKYEFPKAIELLIKELRAPVIQGNPAVLVKPEENTNFIVSPTVDLPDNILDWTQTQVHNWLIGHNLKQMARLLIDFDGQSLSSLDELVRENDSQRILTLLQDDSLRRLNENISLLEFARFRSLLNQRHTSLDGNQHIENNNKLNFFRFCRMM